MKRALVAGFFGALLFTVTVNGPRAYAQAINTAGGVSAGAIVAALLGQDVTATRFIASASTGVGHSCEAVLDTCFDPGPGANNGITVDGSGRTILGAGPGTGIVRVGEAGQVELAENGNVTVVNGALILNGTTTYEQNTGGAVKFDAPTGINTAAKSLTAAGGCVSGREGGMVRDLLSGVSTGQLTRMCLCTSDGAGTPAYAWRNMSCINETTGSTATTCPVCP